MTSQSEHWLVIFSGPDESKFSAPVEGTYMNAVKYAQGVCTGTALRYRIATPETDA